MVQTGPELQRLQEASITADNGAFQLNESSGETSAECAMAWDSYEECSS